MFFTDLDPYNRENRERVARDENLARAKQADDDAYLAARDRSDRIVQLRRQRDAKMSSDEGERRVADAALGRDTNDAAPMSMNFFADLEEAAAKAGAPKRESFFGPTVELHPWYMDPHRISGREKRASDAQKELSRYVLSPNPSRQDEARKQREDPLAHMPRSSRPIQYAPSPSATLSEERQQREAREAERAAALLADRSSAFFRRRARAERAARVHRAS